MSHIIPNNDYSAIYIIRRILKNYVKPYLRKVCVAIFCMVVSAVCSANIVKLVQPTIDKVFLAQDQVMLFLMPIMVAGTFFIKGIAEYYQNYLIKYVGQRVLTDLQMQMYEHLLLADVAFIQSQSSGRIISRITNDIAMMRAAVSNLLVGCAKHFLTVIFLIGVMFHLEPILSCITFVAFPLAVYPVQKLGKKIRKISAQAQEELGTYAARLDETFHSIKIVKSFVREKTEVNKALSIIHNILNFYKKNAKLDALVSPIMEILSGLVISGIIWYGGNLVTNGKTTTGALFAFLTAFASAYRPFKSLVSLNVNLQEGVASAKRVFNILDLQPTIRDHEESKIIDFVNSKIRFNKVGLRFGSKIAVKFVDLELQTNKITAFVGRSGSGKTSLSNLLVRFYDTTEGEIFIDEFNIKDIKIACLREQISLVTQDTHLFDTSILNNITYGNTDATREDVIEAAKYADADEFIRNLPDGYDTLIGPHGTTLSGGQRQRLSIARAFLKNAPILIWDEATSSLDQNSEHKIIESLKKLRKGKTTIIITHRLSSITDVDEIVVLKSGVIIERGNHMELLSDKGEYYKLYNKELNEDYLEGL